MSGIKWNADQHYLTCQNTNCERAACICRRELEDNLSGIRARLAASEARCERYRVALKFYADRRHLTFNDKGIETGGTAREALAQPDDGVGVSDEPK